MTPAPVCAYIDADCRRVVLAHFTAPMPADDVSVRRSPGRPATGRRLHHEAFDAVVALKGLNQMMVARRVGISEGHLSDLRSGRRMVTPPTAKALADALNIPSADAILWPAQAVAA